MITKFMFLEVFGIFALFNYFDISFFVKKIFFFNQCQVRIRSLAKVVSYLKPGIFFVFFVAILHTVNALEMISNYNVIVDVIDKDNFLVIKEITLSNLASSGLIPGEISFELHGIKNVNNLTAVDQYGNVLPIMAFNSGNGVKIRVDDFIPIPSNSNQKIYVGYVMHVPTKGMFFHSLSFYLPQSTIPINTLTLHFCSEDYHISYVPHASLVELDVSNPIMKKKFSNCAKLRFEPDVTERNRSPVYVEFTKLGLNLLPFPGVYLFWIPIILIPLVIALAILIYRYFRKKSRYGFLRW